MSFTTIFIIAGIVIIAIFILIARLAIRWFIRLAIIGIILVALLGGGILWKWTTYLSPVPPAKQRSTPLRSK